MSLLTDVRNELRMCGSPEKAHFLQRFFKTGPGQYAEGDVFIGVTVPQTRKIAKKYRHLTETECSQLLKSEIHEERLLGLLICVGHFEKGDEQTKESVYRFYCRHMQYVNNWDLVDLSAERIVGAYLFTRDRTALYNLAQSDILWERRIAIIATFHFIKNGCFDDTIAIAQLLCNDRQDLIHKAVGWMLREMGKRNELLLESFIRTHYSAMPRTMLRYAIEKFPEPKRKQFLCGKWD